MNEIDAPKSDLQSRDQEFGSREQRAGEVRIHNETRDSKKFPHSDKAD